MVSVCVEDGHVVVTDGDREYTVDSLVKAIAGGDTVNPEIHASEVLWIHQAWADRYTQIAACLCEGVAIVRAPGLRDVAERIATDDGMITCEVASKDAWVVVRFPEEVTVFDRVTEVLRDMGVVLSPEVDNLADGVLKREVMREQYGDALDEGYDAPSMFPTDRTLKPHQKEAVIIMANMEKVLLADQVGLGKGGEFISAFLTRVEKRLKDGDKWEDCFPCVVVTKASLKGEIVEEIHKWDRDATVTMLKGKSADTIPEADFIVTNDAILWDWKDEIVARNPQALIIDEADSVNNPTSKRSKGAQVVSNAVNRNGGLVILATATPFQNGPYELWGLLKVLGVEAKYAKYARLAMEDDGADLSASIASGYGGRRKVQLTGKLAFEARWCNGHVDKWGHWINTGASNPAELHHLLLSNNMVRRKKSDVISPLPELHQDTLMVPLTGDSAREYARQAQQFADYMVDRTVDEALREGTDEDYALNVLFSKLEDSEAVMRVSRLRQTIGYGKAVQAVEWIREFFDTDNITGGDPRRDKLIVFCHHKEVQDLLVNNPDLKRYGMVTISDFNKTPKGIQKAKREFQTDPSTRLMICSSAALSGHTLTAAYDTLMVEMLHGPVATMQAAGRNWARFSEEFEPHESFFHVMVAMDTVDMATYHSNLIKKSLMNGYVDGEDVDLDLVEERGLSLAEREALAKDLLTNATEDRMRIVS